MLYEYVGNIHMHSTYSDGGLTIPEIAGIGSRNNLDFLILTDHQGLTGLEKGQEGFYHQTLLLIGMEVNELKNHYLALNIDEVIPDNEVNPQQVIDDVNKQGGIGIIAHPVERGSKFYHQGITYEWTDWSVQNFQGIEIWNYLSRWRDEVSSMLSGLWLLLRPSAALHKGPYQEVLNILDRYQIKGQKVFAYGGSDAHGITIKCLFTVAEIGSYQEGFRSINMHILTEQALVGDFYQDRNIIYQALAEGNCWVGCDYFKDSRGFRYFARTPQGKWGMGSTVPEQADLYLQVKTPDFAKVSVIYNGKPWASSQGRDHIFPVNRPGVYRVEAQHRRGFTWQPWIYSNPIWIE